MKHYCLFLSMVALASGIAVYGQSKAPGRKTGPAPAAKANKLLPDSDGPMDACFRNPFSSTLWAKHLDTLFSLAQKSLTDEDKNFNKPFLLNSQQVEDVKAGRIPSIIGIVPNTQRTSEVVVDDSHPERVNNDSSPRLATESQRTPAQPEDSCGPATTHDGPIDPVFRPIGSQEKNWVLAAEKSVGRLQLKDQGVNGPQWVGLGTAFVIARGVIATNCHVISDFVIGGPGHWQLAPKYAKSFAIDFSDSGESADQKKFVIADMYQPPEEIGFDVVFLKVAESNQEETPLPDPIPLSEENLVVDPSPRAGVLIGYPGHGDNLDCRSEKLYGAFGVDRYTKFVVPGGMTDVQGCTAPLKIILTTISTTPGQSGSPIIDRQSKLVVGVHTCCADYSAEGDSTTIPVNHFSCASKKDTVSNQAISSWSIWQEPNLAKVLNDQKSQQTTAASAPSAPH